MSINWDVPIEPGHPKTVFTYVKELIAERKSAKQIHAQLKQKGFVVSLPSLKNKAQGEGLVFNGFRGRPAGSWSKSGDSAPPRPISFEEDFVTEGIPFLEIEDGQCRHVLRGEGIMIVYCGNKTKGRRYPKCGDHGGPKDGE